MKPAQKRLLLALGLVGTLALVWFAPTDEEGVSTPATDKSRRGGQTTAARSKLAKAPGTSVTSTDTRPGQLNNLERTPLAETIPDLFAGFSWYVPPPPPPPTPPPPPPPPTAPPLPFTYLGQYVDGQTKLIILTRGDRMISVSVGEIIDSTYQVGSLKGGQLTFLYLPLKVEQSLSTGVSP